MIKRLETVYNNIQKKPYRLYFISAVLCLLFCSCNNDKHFNDLLPEAEQKLMTNPDSALILLSQIPESDKLKGEEQALYCLLYTAAKFRLYESQSDSMISIAVGYYEKNGTDAQKMEAYYYMGCVAEDMKDAPRAQDFYRKALEAGKEVENNSLSGRIASRIAMLYTHQYLYKTALPYYEKALEYYRLCDDKSRQAIVLRNLGRTYSMNQEPDSAVSYYEKALLMANGNEQEILSELGDLYITKGEYAKASDYLRRSLEYESLSTTEPYHTYLSYGKLFYFTHNNDSATYYLGKCLESNNDETRMDAYEYMAKINKDDKNWDEYARIQEQYEELSKRIRERTHTETIAQMEHLYNYQTIENALSKSEIGNIHKKSIIFICLIIIIILSIILVAGYNYIKKERTEKLLQKQRFEKLKAEQLRYSLGQIEKNKQYIIELEEKLSSQQASGDELERLSLEKERVDIENRRIEYENKERTQLIGQLQKSDIYSKFHNEGGFRATDSDWKEFESLIDHTFPQFSRQLRLLLPKMTDIEFNVCCLVKINVPATNMAIIINRSRQSVTMIRKRLYNKIYGESGSTKDFDDFILNL